MYKMHDVVKSYKEKIAKTRNGRMPQKIDDTMADFENESFPSERPDCEVPVPHKMNPLNSKRFSTDLTAKEENKISKNETNTTSKAQTDDSFGHPRKQNMEQVRESASTLISNSGEVLEMTVNRTDSVDDKFKDEHFSTESPIPKKKPSFNFEDEEEKEQIRDVLPSDPKRTSFYDFFEKVENAEKDEDPLKIRSTMKHILEDSNQDFEEPPPKRSMSDKLLPQPDMVDYNKITSPTKQIGIRDKKLSVWEQTQKLLNTVFETQMKYERQRTERKNTLGSV